MRNRELKDDAQTISKQKTPAIIALLAAALIWGMGFIATNIAQDAQYSSPYIMMTRFIIASLIFGLVAYKKLQRILPFELRAGILSGIFLFLGFALQTFGLEDTTPTRNAFFTATSILFVPFISWLVFRQRPPLRIFIAAFICFPGVLALSLDGELALVLSRGDLLTLACAVAFALHTVILGYFAVSIDAVRLNFLQLCTAAVLSIALYLWLGAGLATEPMLLQPAFLAVLFLAVFSTCIAFFLQTKAMQYVSPGTASVIVASESLFASVLSLGLGFEKFTTNLLIGGSLIFLAVLVTEWNPRRKREVAREA